MATQTNEQYSVIGKRPVRHDGVDKVTGKALYGADMNLPGMLFGKVLRSPHAHAKILSIDISRALSNPSVIRRVIVADLLLCLPLPIFLSNRFANFSGMLMLMIRRSPARCLAMMWLGSYLFNKLTISIAFYLLITKK